MKLGVLFSGGKDSCFALSKAMKENKVECLISILSKNKESFMFHVPNIDMTQLQSEAMGIPLLKVTTEGKKEDELKDLENAISQAKEKFKIEGIVTGAVRSIYQASRIQKICKRLDLWCFDPLWVMDEAELLNEIVGTGIRAIISGVFAYPLDREMLGKAIDRNMIEKLIFMRDKYKINPAGEGGELETTVLDAPFFKKRIEIEKSETEYKDYSGIFEITQARLVEK
jgi:diphthine-ammonia ligase